MTLLEMIRTLHAGGQPVLDYDLYVCDNSALTMDELADRALEDNETTALISPMIPPQYIELGDRPKTLYVKTLEEYLAVTHAKKNIPKRFPRLLAAVFTDRSGGFLPCYRGKNWRDIPPIEIFWLTRDGLLLPVLDAEGALIDTACDGEFSFMEPATYYTVRSEWGTDFAWTGDLARDPLPAGLRLLEK